MVFVNGNVIQRKSDFSLSIDGAFLPIEYLTDNLKYNEIAPALEEYGDKSFPLDEDDFTFKNEGYAIRASILCRAFHRKTVQALFGNDAVLPFRKEPVPEIDIETLQKLGFAESFAEPELYRVTGPAAVELCGKTLNIPDGGALNVLLADGRLAGLKYVNNAEIIDEACCKLCGQPKKETVSEKDLTAQNGVIQVCGVLGCSVRLHKDGTVETSNTLLTGREKVLSMFDDGTNISLLYEENGQLCCVSTDGTTGKNTDNVYYKKMADAVARKIKL